MGITEHRALPIYPDEAIRKGTQGDVLLKVLIDPTGKLIRVEPVDGDPLLIASSLEALHDFRFRPYSFNGQPLSVESQIGFHFALKKDGKKPEVEQLSSVPFRPEFRNGLVGGDGSVVLSPRQISGSAPQLPPELDGKSGSVYLKYVIDEEGKVQDIQVVSGDQPFIEPSIAAVKTYTYEPQLMNGKPVKVTTQAAFHFGRN